MATESKLFDKIRITPRNKPKPKPEETGAKAPGQCQWEGCMKPGAHRAPAGRHRENEYFLFCVEHVREYNKGYNYFSGLEDTDIAAMQRDALTGHRPTWKMGTNGQVKAAPQIAAPRSGRAGYYKKVGINPFGDVAASPRARQLKPLEREAMRTLGVKDVTDPEGIRARYADLVKQHHPDANGGVRGSEERLAEVIKAYRLLKKAGHC
jgi:curved DNA-binding protein CbpA